MLGERNITFFVLNVFCLIQTHRFYSSIIHENCQIKHFKVSSRCQDLKAYFGKFQYMNMGSQNQNSTIECSNQGSIESWYLLVEIRHMSSWKSWISTIDTDEFIPFNWLYKFNF